MVSYTVFSLLLAAVLVNAEDYCKYNCGSEINVGCNNPGVPASTCVDYKDIEMTEELKQDLLDEHNFFRGLVARGVGELKDNETTPTAAKMMKLKWDDELAYLASLNVKTCKMEHDCADTSKGWSGQNIYSFATTGTIDPKGVVKSVLLWYNENRDTRKSDIESLPGVYVNGKAIGHYTQVIWGNTDKVGCAASTFKSGKWNKLLVTCNYRGGNLLGASVYKIGKLCSACPNGCEKGLCL
ncbi:venom allergen 3-like [Ctenocephalides felis]|uniref:venom allergen 3-like n=1 Tax=Ctenocephalides felis TaxID=7515 RepID=UPI000E6E5896|nr:venom allergen 3-like [Ctenocephalides felis]